MCARAGTKQRRSQPRHSIVATSPGGVLCTNSLFALPEGINVWGLFEMGHESFEKQVLSWK